MPNTRQYYLLALLEGMIVMAFELISATAIQPIMVPPYLYGVQSWELPW